MVVPATSTIPTTSTPRASPEGLAPTWEERTRRALLLLDEWSTVPRSRWCAVGARRAAALPPHAHLTTAPETVLERVVTHHVDPFDAWIVRDAAETAWFLAPADDRSPAQTVVSDARRAVTTAALAVLVREWLPDEVFEQVALNGMRVS